jgi:outer membrane protein OmpA-like peptidoglycan-associated protein
VTAVFEDEQVTLTGAVPSQAAADRVVAVALGFRLTPATVVNNLTIDPDAPISGGVRVVEFNSVHFVDDTSVITPDQARQLDRIVVVMNAFPDAMVHVVGNTDQRGEETRNFVVSQRRAEAVVAYLVSQGIDRSRLTTQPAGESNLLSLEVTEEAHSLNRRTDFVFYGLLGD